MIMSNNIIFLCPSWEERSYLGFEQDNKDIVVNKVIAINKVQPINGTEISVCIDKIKNACHQKAIAYEELMWKESPIENANILNSSLKQFDENDVLHIDITTMPRDIIWTLLFFLNHNPNRVIIRYYQPISYCDTWLSKEPYSPRLLLKHSGIIELGKPLCVVIVTGFDMERTRQIVSKFEPHKVVLCIQKGPQFNNANRNEVNKHELICKSTGVSNVSSVDIDCYGEDFGGETIENVISSLSDYNIIISSFGPKPSAIGVYMAYQKHQEVALCYVPCKEYNKDYCKGIGNLYTINYK